MAKWFKFYGQDYLTDPKIKTLTAEKRQCWIVLLCLASAEEKEGKIKNVIETEIMNMAGIDFDGQTWHETLGFLKRFKKLEMITIDNIDKLSQCYHITLTNFKKRQEQNLTGYERLKKHRDKVKIDNEMITLDKIRVDKNTNRGKKPYYDNFPLYEIKGVWKIRRGDNDFSEFSNDPADWKKVVWK